MAKPISVYDLTATIRELLEGSRLLQNFWVSGEISNFKVHSSGHCYFTLKDERASIRSIMWRSRASALRFRPTDGMKVLAKGSIGVYERDGNYQFYADQIEPDGLGTLYAAYEQLKGKLESEGLFAVTRKRPLPRFPQTIAVLTSPTGAALRDVVTVIKRRYPVASVLIFPVIVQGPEAPASLVSALQSVCNHTIDVVIIGRGGGSIEDLWAFNDEQVARAIAACPCPVVSAVGHETDFTIADFVDDLRAPTPSAAAELVVPDINDLARQLTLLNTRLERALKRKVQTLRQYLDQLSPRLQAGSPKRKIKEDLQRAVELRQRMRHAMTMRLAHARGNVTEQAARLEALSPVRVLARGYSLTRHGTTIIKRYDDVAIGDTLVTTLQVGSLLSVVTGKEEPR